MTDSTSTAITCRTCDDAGWVTVPEHSSACDGFTCHPELCPVPVQAPCPDCVEPTGRSLTLDTEEPF